MRVVVLFFSTICVCCFAAGADKPVVYYGVSDASAAVGINDEMFVVADDENNVLQVYRIGETGGPVGSYDLSGFLETTVDHPEADIEGAAVAGDRVYWITSHGRNKDGKMRPNRYRFFATKIEVSGSTVKIKPVGVPYRRLVSELVENRYMRGLGLDKASRLDARELKKKDREKLAPKEEGLNIESLTASADGKTLYIGFRNPLVKGIFGGKGRAIIVPVCNADAVVEKSAKPEFGKPLLWDLGGLGLRSMEYSGFHKAYFIVAGSHKSGGSFFLYRWSGDHGEKPVEIGSIGDGGFNAEALVAMEKSGKLLLLSDDGTLEVTISDASECMEGELMDDNKCLNKHLVNPDKKTFRALFIEP